MCNLKLPQESQFVLLLCNFQDYFEQASFLLKCCKIQDFFKSPKSEDIKILLKFKFQTLEADWSELINSKLHMHKILG